MFAPEGDGCLQRAKREDAGRFSKEGKSLDDFCRAFGHSKARERKSFFNVKDNTSSTAIAVPLLPLEKALYPLFLLQNQAQKKKLSKRKRQKKLSRSAERDKGDLPLTQPPFEKGGRKLYYSEKNY